MDDRTASNPDPETATVESKSTEKVSKLQKNKTGLRSVLTIQQVVTLIISIPFMIMILQIPTILYYNNQPSLSTTNSIGIDFDTCSVSFCQISFLIIVPDIKIAIDSVLVHYSYIAYSYNNF